ncbi:MAG: alpha/beta hydrolase [Verrucomicrobiota bacterium]
MNSLSRFLFTSFGGLVLLLCGGLELPLWAQSSAVTAVDSEKKEGAATCIKDVQYIARADITPYEAERCKLDLYLPGTKNFQTVVWFHGVSLKEGGKTEDYIPKLAARLNAEGIALVAADYRLSPKVLFPAYVQDAAAAVAWVSRNIEEHGGNPAAIFVGGHSAGGYLSLMVGLDGHYLEEQGVTSSVIAGLLPVSAQVMTHYTVREERGIEKFRITADDAAPVYFIRKSLMPILLLYADRDFPARSEENAYFVAIAKDVGHRDVGGYMVKDRNHVSVAKRLCDDGDLGFGVMLAWIKDRTKRRP